MAISKLINCCINSPYYNLLIQHYALAILAMYTDDNLVITKQGNADSSVHDHFFTSLHDSTNHLYLTASSRAVFSGIKAGTST